jgi:hypothetical protein
MESEMSLARKHEPQWLNQVKKEVKETEVVNYGK